MDNRPLGIFDSGVGGLSIWKKITAFLPGESIIYLADQNYFPYGEKSKREVEKRTEKICLFLIRKKVKMIIVACNTATVLAIDYLRRRFSVPFVGVEPAVKPATRLTGASVIGVLATKGTVKSERQRVLIKKFGQEKEFVSVDCSELTPLIEKAEANSRKTVKTLEKYLLPLKKKRVDVLVLGCTHYLFLKKQIRKIMGMDIKIIDPSMAIVRQTEKVLKTNNLLSHKRRGVLTFFTTGDPEKLRTFIVNFFNFPVEVNKLRF